MRSRPLLTLLRRLDARLTLAADARIDTDMIVTSDLTSAHWEHKEGAEIASATRVAGGVILNDELAEDSYLWRCHQFTIPPGCTQVTVSYTVRTAYDGDTGHKILTRLANRSLSSVLHSEGSDDVTDTPVTYEFDQAVTAGDEYAFIIYCSAGGATHSRFMITDISITINAGTGVFASSFKRIAVDDKSLDLCSPLDPPAYSNDAYVLGTCLSRVRMKTDAVSFYVEHMSALASNRLTFGDIGLWENFRPTDHIQTTSKAQAWLEPLTAIYSGERTVDIVNGYQQDISPDDNYASMARAIYLPASASLEIYRTTADLVIYGASLICGRSPESPCNEGVPAQLRLGTDVAVVCDGRGSQRMKDHCETESGRIAKAARMASFGAHRYWIEHAINDYAQSSIWSAADFGAAYADLLDKIKAADTAAHIYCQTPCLFYNEDTANAYGDTLDDYRAVITAAANAREFCTLVDGESWFTLDDYVSEPTNPIHPRSDSSQKYVDNIKAAIPALWPAPTPIISNALAEYHFDDGDVFFLRDHTGNGHHGIFGSTAFADAACPSWDSDGYLDFSTNDGIRLPASYKAAVGTGARTYVAVFQMDRSVNYSYVFGSNAPGYGMMLYQHGTSGEIAGSTNQSTSIVQDPNAVPTLTWVFALHTYEPSTRNTLWTTSTGSLSKVAEDTSLIPASLQVLTEHWIGNDSRLTKPMGPIAFAAVIDAAVADVDVPGIYALVKAAVAEKPTPIVLP